MGEFVTPQEIGRLTHSDGAFFGIGYEGHDAPEPASFEASLKGVEPRMTAEVRPDFEVDARPRPIGAKVAIMAAVRAQVTEPGVQKAATKIEWWELRPEQ